VELVPLRAGPLTMLYDPTTGFLRRIRLGEIELWRGVYAAVRDRNWGTTPGALREIVRALEAHSFRIVFESEHQQGDIHFLWRGTIVGQADGTLRYEFDGEARTTFLRNRIGFCVLHPIRECAGARARQTGIDGSVVECRFPELIEPQIFGRSTFRDLRSVAHEFSEGQWAELQFEGDVFEMEDQRNWSDASFKTYCTPLSLPFPVEVSPGTKIQQTVTMRLLRLTSKPTVSRINSTSDRTEVLSVTFDGPQKRLPQIGLGVATHGQRLTDHEISTLRRLRPSHLRVDLRLATGNWTMKLDQAAAEAEQLEARLELAVHLPPKADVDTENAARALDKHAALFARVLALREGEAATSPETLRHVRKLLGSIDVPVGAGSDYNFCELNREQALGRLAGAEADFLFWPSNPQVHAFDHLSVIETIEAHAATVRSARAFANRRPLIVSPLTLKQRFNPVATGPALHSRPEDLPAEVDARQLSHFCAAWTTGCLAALAMSGIESVTLFETTGWRGVMESTSGSSLPDKFPAAAGMTFPVFDTLTSLAGLSRLAVAVNFQPNQLVALGFYAGTSLSQVLVANLGDQPRQIDCAARSVTLRAYEVKMVSLVI
jgi:D-apionolactonase